MAAIIASLGYIECVGSGKGGGRVGGGKPSVGESVGGAERVDGLVAAALGKNPFRAGFQGEIGIAEVPSRTAVIVRQRHDDGLAMQRGEVHPYSVPVVPHNIAVRNQVPTRQVARNKIAVITRVDAVAQRV